MHYVGIDLAWGVRNPTGLAVLDDRARLLHVAAVLTDDEIEADLQPYVDGPCVVGIDAPLVVTNPTGRRPAEAQLTADFGRFDAGAYPSNTGLAVFTDGPRGGHLARRLGLDLDPRSGRRRRAIEVYPHAAAVVLFGLDKVLRYKHKQGRDVALLRAELLSLMAHLEMLVTVSDQWRALRSTVEGATRKVELRRVEDQVDAVLCAYVALFADRHPERVTTYGDTETGAIVTPTLSAPLTDPLVDPVEPPTAGRPPAPGSREDVAAAAVREYDARHPALVGTGERALRLVRGLLDEAGINYLTVDGRTKSVVSFSEKASRTRDGLALYDDPARQITDQVGVRVITYVQADVAAVADVLAEQLTVAADRDLGEETASEGRFGYASRHLLIELGGADVGTVAQVQIRTVLQHAWAEFEHDVRYKGVVPPEHAPEFDRRFTLAAGLLELADQEFSQIRARVRGATLATADVDAGPHGALGPRELAAYLAGQYSEADWSRSDHYSWLADLLSELDVTTLVGLGEALRGADETAIAERMDYRHPPRAVRRLDDALLWVFAERYVDLTGNAHRTDLLRQRLARMRGTP